MVNPLGALGLTDNEYKVYRALLDFGPSLAGVISRKTGLHRRTVYDTTEMLIQKGLIGYILRNNRRVFEASHPERLTAMIEERSRSLNLVMPDLLERYSRVKEKNETNFYKGKEGIKSVFEDQLQYKEVLVIGATSAAYDVLQFYFHWYDVARKKKKIPVKIITTDTRITKVALSEVRYLPKRYESPMAINVYGNKVAIVLWMNEPIAIVITHQDVADSYRKYFDLLWGVASVKNE